MIGWREANTVRDGISAAISAYGKNMSRVNQSELYACDAAFAVISDRHLTAEVTGSGES